MAMKKVSIKVRLTLNRLRKVQRDRQLEIEARLKNVEKIPSKYCQICKLYFRQSKIEHRDSDDHKKIRNFLKPYCKVNFDEFRRRTISINLIPRLNEPGLPFATFERDEV